MNIGQIGASRRCVGARRSRVAPFSGLAYPPGAGKVRNAFTALWRALSVWALVALLVVGWSVW